MPDTCEANLAELQRGEPVRQGRWTVTRHEAARKPEPRVLRCAHQDGATGRTVEIKTGCGGCSRTRHYMVAGCGIYGECLPTLPAGKTIEPTDGSDPPRGCGGCERFEAG